VPHQPLRMIDANLNRMSEGLRVLEDVARFVLDDAQLSQRLRALRHELMRGTGGLRIELLSHRDSDEDVGRHCAFSLEQKSPVEQVAARQSLLEVVTANAKRVQESLRVIEELAKLPELSGRLNSASFERGRFSLYSLEKDLISRISRREKREKIAGLYPILDRQFLAGRDELDVATDIIEAGARVIQLRDKQSSKRELLSVAQKLRELCTKASVLFIINDYLDLALAVDADGVHVGQKDLPLPVVRKELSIDRIVGCSVTTVSQALEAVRDGADYIAVGSIFSTATKKDATVVGLDRLREVRQRVSIPVVAIGGINCANVGQVVSAGADAVAVISAVLGERDVREAARKLVTAIGSVKRQCQDQ